MYKTSSRFQQRLRAHRVLKDSLPEGPSSSVPVTDGVRLLSATLQVARDYEPNRYANAEIVDISYILAQAEISSFLETLSDEQIDVLIEVKHGATPLGRDLRTALEAALGEYRKTPVSPGSVLELFSASRLLEQTMREEAAGNGRS
jgi:hypothetical protein